VPLIVIRRQLGHSNIGIASVYRNASTLKRRRTLLYEAAPLGERPSG
jgi:hypothetical protein